jgi:acetate kinase
MKAANPMILTLNGGSSSIKFALFEVGEALRRRVTGAVTRIGLPSATLEVKDAHLRDNLSRQVEAPNQAAAVGVLMDWLAQHGGAIAAVGHRVVHGGPNYSQPVRITPEIIEELRKLSPFDPEHLPEEILLIEAVHRQFPALPQVACFDTAFYHDLPRVARMLPIPRRYGGSWNTSVRVPRDLVCLPDGRACAPRRSDGDDGPSDPGASRERREPDRRA